MRAAKRGQQGRRDGRAQIIPHRGPDRHRRVRPRRGPVRAARHTRAAAQSIMPRIRGRKVDQRWSYLRRTAVILARKTLPPLAQRRGLRALKGASRAARPLWPERRVAGPCGSRPGPPGTRRSAPARQRAQAAGPSGQKKGRAEARPKSNREVRRHRANRSATFKGADRPMNPSVQYGTCCRCGMAVMTAAHSCCRGRRRATTPSLGAVPPRVGARADTAAAYICWRFR